MTEQQLPHPVTGEPFSSPVPAGVGWPGDSADSATPVARTAAQVARTAQQAHAAGDLAALEAATSVCAACPRLVSWREDVAHAKRAAFADQPYWGRPIAGWGDPEPRVLVIGLAPAANGGNRTGRVFTGDPSGDWLFPALHRAGLAVGETSEHAGDGQQLVGTRLIAAVRCAPPQNKPTVAERDTCAPWLDAEVAMVVPHVRVVVALGQYAWDAALRTLPEAGVSIPSPKPRFGHGAEVSLTLRSSGADDGRSVTLLGCYHPSQRNTATGRLTTGMLDDVFTRAARMPA